MEQKKSWLDEKAIETGDIDGHKFYIVPAPLEDALNGYIVFDKKPVIEDSYNGLLTYIPVHGGITYAENVDGKYVYGFDTLHYNSEKYPRKDKEWIKSQIKIMLDGILKAASI